MCNSSFQKEMGLSGAERNLEIRAVSFGANRPNPEVRNAPPRPRPSPTPPRVLQPGLAPVGAWGECTHKNTHTHIRTRVATCHGVGWGLLLAPGGAQCCSTSPFPSTAQLKCQGVTSHLLQPTLRSCLLPVPHLCPPPRDERGPQPQPRRPGRLRLPRALPS